jgi:hypothetical protein
MIDPFDATVFLVVPAAAVLLAAGALWLQARSTRAFDVRWGATAASDDAIPQTGGSNGADKPKVGGQETPVTRGVGS